jgi:hypothetical protein
MPWRIIVAVGACAVAAALLARITAGTGQAPGGKNGVVTDGKPSPAPFALVELFTSEGCSSCPPADMLLGELLQDARKHGRRAFGLAFHVDYWDQLGWTDPDGARAFSLRQQAYARALKSGSVYTPQMIVNGGTEFVGSDRARARAAIDAALQRPATARIELRLREPKTPASLPLAFAVAPVPRAAVLHLAIVQRGVTRDVKRGENAGRILRHDNVVRVFETLTLDESGTGSAALPLPVGLPRQDASLIAYVQEAGSRGILGATELALAASASR